MRARAELTCREVIEFVADYLDCELGSHERERFEAHLAACPDCRTYLDQYAMTRALGRVALDDGAVEAGVPEDLVRAIIAARPSRGGKRAGGADPRAGRRRRP